MMELHILAANKLPLIANSPDNENRQWVLICRVGKNIPVDGRRPFILENPDKVIQASRNKSGNVKMLVDYDHQSMNTNTSGQPAPAAGWVSEFKVDSEGIWALIEWTTKAAKHIMNKEFRHVSPVLMTTKNGTITRIHNVALVNEPALEELTVLAKAEINMDKEDQVSMTEIQQLLGLDNEAGLTEILEAIRGLLTQQNSANPDPAKFVPISVFKQVVKETNKLRQGISEDGAVRYVEQCLTEMKLLPYMRDWAINLCTTNKPAFDEFLEHTQGSIMILGQELLPNDYDAVHGNKSNGNLTATETEICERMGLTSEEYLAALPKSKSI